MASPVPRPSKSRLKNPIFFSPPRDLIIYDQEELDRGAYGSVYTGEFAGRPVAVKRIHPPLLEAHSAQGQQVRRNFQAECQRMKDIVGHANVVGFIGAFQDRTGPFLVMEKMAQNLYKFLEANSGTLRLQQQLRLCLDIATGLVFLHSRVPPLVHRDLTARNVLLDESGRAKIGDLGQSKLRTAAPFQTRQPGAVPYMPPEALRTQPQYTEKVDIFSFGVLMLEIATQTPPSGRLDGIDVTPEEERRSSDLARLADDHPLKSLIRSCLKNEPGERPDAATLLEELQEVFQQLTQASIVFTQAKNHLSGAIKSLESCHCKVMQLAEKTASPELEGARGLSTVRVAEILKVVERSEMKVVFFGRTSNGKSTVINALLKSKVLPSGYGSTTTDICYIRGQNTATEGGSVMIGGSNGFLTVQSPQALASCIQEPRDIQIYWSTAQCSMLTGDIVLVDCPGMNAEDDVDDKVIECCSDADVFVYVANGTATFETSERDMLAKVKERISTPSNTFILFNHWDKVEDDGEEQARRVKKQQISKVIRIMAHELSIFTEELAKSRTFFVSARQAVNNAERNSQQSVTPESHLQQEFSRFEEMLQDTLFEAAIKTKFGRHCSECQSIVASLSKAVSGMKRRWKEERDVLVEENSRENRNIANIDREWQNFQRMYDQKVTGALKRIDVMCDEFYSKIIAELPATIDSYLQEKGFDHSKIHQYHSDMEELLQRKLQEESQCLKEQWSDVAADLVQSLSAPLWHVEENISRLEAGEASSRLGGDIPTTSRPSRRAQILQRLPSWQRTRRLIIGSSAGAVIGGVVGIAAVATVPPLTLLVAGPIATTVGAALFGGGSFLRWKPNSTTEGEAKEEIKKQLIACLDRHNKISKQSYKAGLTKHAKSSTNAVSQRVEEQRQERYNAAAELLDGIESHRLWLSEACDLNSKLEEVELQLKQFRETYL